MIKRGRKEGMEVDQVQVVMVVHMYMGFVNATLIKKWFSKEPCTYGFGTGTLTNDRPVKCSSAWMPVARGLKLAMSSSYMARNYH